MNFKTWIRIGGILVILLGADPMLAVANEYGGSQFEERNLINVRNSRHHCHQQYYQGRHSYNRNYCHTHSYRGAHSHRGTDYYSHRHYRQHDNRYNHNNRSGYQNR